MILKIKTNMNRLLLHYNSPLFLRAARCTNASALDILPSSPSDSSGMKPRNSASLATQIIKS
jgi:hypothetical protein